MTFPIGLSLQWILKILRYNREGRISWLLSLSKTSMTIKIVEKKLRI